MHHPTDRSLTVYIRRVAPSVAFTDGAQNVLNGTGEWQRVRPMQVRQVPSSSLAISPSFCCGPAASTRHLALFIGSSPDVCPTSHRVQRDGPKGLAFSAWVEGPLLPHPGPTSSALILVWAQGLLPQLGPLADLLSSLFRLERPGRVPAGGPGRSPGLLPSMPGLWPEPGQGPS